ncbi:serine hydrolase domain-containing protein [Flavobacterium lacustre]|uniref:serine hydrolase domain-containing protein n=1 Tax=Flavobacterium lacustre TaxID=3016339 RepID=UPI0022B5FFF3|nr:serine hydrolase [Flavobacterium lacustre]
MKQTYLILFTSLLFSKFCFGQDHNSIEPEPIKTELHQSNISKILFTEKRISYENIKKENFLNTYKLTNKSDLFFVAYFNNSLTNYKHQLLPQVSSDSLFKIGNYQFTLYIDSKLIYQSNLLPGAPPAKNQNTDTYLNRPFIDNVNGQGTWSESFWNRFMNNGGDKILTDGNHLLKMEIRPYVKTDTIKTGEIIASGELILEVARHPKIDITKIQLNKIKPYNGLTISNASFNKKKIKQLKGAIDEGIFKKINSIIVLKEGEILIEEYFNGENRNSLHDPRSVGKSFSSTLTGIAINDGFISGDTQTLSHFYNLSQFKNLTPSKGNATIKDLLTMSSGFDGNDEDGSSVGNEENMYPTQDWVKFTLDLPYQESLKEKWHYFTAGVVLLGDILNKSVPNGLEKYADDKLFKPLGITKYKWQYTPQNVPNTAGGIQMNALDFAKYGQLYKNGGTWNNQQILPNDWVEKTFTKQKQIVGRDSEYYGYLFWNKTFKANTKDYEAFYCAGNGGNYILVFKNEPLVIVITASAYGQHYAHSQVTEMLSKYILPAITK